MVREGGRAAVGGCPQKTRIYVPNVIHRADRSKIIYCFLSITDRKNGSASVNFIILTLVQRVRLTLTLLRQQLLTSP